MHSSTHGLFSPPWCANRAATMPHPLATPCSRRVARCHRWGDLTRPPIAVEESDVISWQSYRKLGCLFKWQLSVIALWDICGNENHDHDHLPAWAQQSEEKKEREAAWVDAGYERSLRLACLFCR